MVMCGRFTQTQDADAIAQAFQVSQVPLAPPRYNIAPTQYVGAVVQPPSGDRQFRTFRWGLVPSWAKDPAIANRLINARSETVTEKPSFRSAIRYRRCLIIADGFYEWQRQGRTKKQPYYFHLAEQPLFGLAGLWEEWTSSTTGEILQTCTILTIAANELLQPIHDRMPVILRPADYDRWLDPHQTRVADVLPLLQPYPAAAMQAYPVSPVVNRATYDQPDCLAPVNPSVNPPAAQSPQGQGSLFT